MSALRLQCILLSKLLERAQLVERNAGEREGYAFPAAWLPLSADGLLELPTTKDFKKQRDSLPLVTMSEEQEHWGEKKIKPFAR